MKIQAPGKINLFLRVGRRRADGYHPVATWMCTVGLFDTLEFKRARRAGIVLNSDVSDMPVGPGNLIYRAAEALQRAGADHPSANVGGLAVSLRKRIPIGAGLGGGSSNAASTLLTLNRLWQIGLDREQLAEIAGELGSDVPFFLGNQSAICSGRGEIIDPAPLPLPACCVLILPPFSLSTVEVYRQFDQMNAEADGEQDGNAGQIATLASLPATDLLARLLNDLEKPAFAIRPELKRLREEMEQKSGRPVRMSGSGSTLFTLADEMEEGRDLAARLDGGGVRAMAVELGV